MQLAVRYGLFAALSMAANLSVQALVLTLLRSEAAGLALAMAAGTLTGVALKYWLDKRWIFNTRTDRVGRQVRQIALYSVFSVVTTLVFWTTETGFAMIWRSATVTYIGATLGLCCGYALKYYLDKRFTFGDQGDDV